MNYSPYRYYDLLAYRASGRKHEPHSTCAREGKNDMTRYGYEAQQSKECLSRGKSTIYSECIRNEINSMPYR